MVWRTYSETMQRKRGRRIGFFLSEAELRMLQAIADSNGLSKSDTLRSLIRIAASKLTSRSDVAA